MTSLSVQLFTVPTLAHFLIANQVRANITLIRPTGLWIRIHFSADPDPAVLLNADPDRAAFLMRIRIQLLFLMRIRIQLIKICNKLPYEEYSGVKKYKQDYSKVKNHRADANLLTIKTNFLAFFCYFPKKFPPGSGSTALPTYIKVVLYKYHFIRGKTNFVIYCWLV